jgi:hypothetical protein
MGNNRWRSGKQYLTSHQEGHGNIARSKSNKTAEQSRAEQSRAEQSRAEQRVGYSKIFWSREAEVFTCVDENASG